MKRLLIPLLLIACLFGAAPVQAQSAAYTKPAGAPTLLVPNYNVTTSVWVTVSLVGSFIAIFELQPDGRWFLVDSDFQYAEQNFDAAVASNGGPSGWLQNIGIPHINPILSHRYPPIGGPPSGNAVDQVNNALGVAYVIKTVNGITALGLK